MSEKVVLNVTPREPQGNGGARRCRRAGLIPAIIYGKGTEPVAVSLDAREFRPYAHKSLHLVDLKDPSGKVTLALLKSMDFDYMKDIVVHIDFQAVDMNEAVTAKVPVRYVGTAKGASQGGLCEDLVHEIEISCKASAMIDVVEVDVSGVQLDAVIHVGDIKLPAGVKCITDAAVVAFAVKLPAVDAAAAAAAE